MRFANVVVYVFAAQVVPKLQLDCKKINPLSDRAKRPMQSRFLGGATIHIEVNTEGEVVAVRNVQGEEIPHIYAYWFAWQAFHPDTTVYKGAE